MDTREHDPVEDDPELAAIADQLRETASYAIPPELKKNCLLCRKYVSRIFESKYFFVIYDDFPLRQGHLLIIPIRHLEHLTLLTRAEFTELGYVIKKMVKHLKDNFHIDGYNVGINCGEAAGQTLSHMHIHLIPRHFGDVPDLRGGIRKFLPNPVKEYP